MTTATILLLITRQIKHKGNIKSADGFKTAATATLLSFLIAFVRWVSLQHRGI